MNTPQQTPGPDVHQLKDQKLPEAAFAGGKSQAFRVWFAPEVHAGIWKHAVDNGSVEICGVVVGRWARDAAGPHVQANAYIRGEAASSKFAEVTFTHDTWSKINQEMDQKYADQAVIGWYHSHPDFGIFLSDRDKFIQEHFFCGPGQFAFVVDPVRKTEGVFIWQQGKPVLAPYHWVGESLQISTPAGESPPPPKDREQPISGSATPVLSARPPDWIDTLMRIAGYACVFLLGVLLAGFLNLSMNDLERLRVEQAATARALLYFHARTGLKLELDEARAELASAQADLDRLQQDHLRRMEDPKEAKEKWEVARKQLVHAAALVGIASVKFDLTPQELKMLNRYLGWDKSGQDKEESKPKSEAAGGTKSSAGSEVKKQ
jgi:proteasome lid subunit RPN8/RPN11